MEMAMKYTEQIESLDKLKIEEAKDLYTKAINTKDERLKKLYLDKVILGTMHIINNFIKNSNLYILQSSQYDLEDIQSALTEIWIKKIKDGDLLKFDSYSRMFYSFPFNDIYIKVCGDEMNISEQFGITKNCFAGLFYYFIKLKNNGVKFGLDELVTTYCHEKGFNYCGIPHIPKSKENILLSLYEKMYNNLTFDKTEDLDLPKNKALFFIKLFINNGLYDELSDDLVADDLIEKSLNNLFYKDFINDVDKELTKENRRIVIHQRYGLDNENPKIYDDIKKNLNVTRERVRDIEREALRQLRRSPSINKKYHNVSSKKYSYLKK